MDLKTVRSKVTGQCGDSITTNLILEKNIINHIEQEYDGCAYTAACAVVTSSIAKGLSLERALKITPEMIIKKIINLPKDNFHCAKLAINSLGEAISKYYFNQRQITKIVRDKDMINTIIVAGDKNNLGKFTSYLEKNLCNKVKYINNQQLIIDTIKNKSALVIVRCNSSSFNSVKLVQKILELNAFTNIVLMSNDSHDEVENKFEGLGVLMQLSDPPMEEEIEILCKKL